jgi:hypothetical protein
MNPGEAALIGDITDAGTGAGQVLTITGTDFPIGIIRAGFMVTGTSASITSITYPDASTAVLTFNGGVDEETITFTDHLYGLTWDVEITESENPPVTAGTLSFDQLADTSVRLNWTAGSGGTGTITAQLHRGTTPGFTISGGTAVSGGTTSPKTDTGRTEHTRYYYRVRYTDSVAETADSNEVTVLTAIGSEYMETFVDNHFIDTITGATRSILRPAKYGSNPILPPTGEGPFTWDRLPVYGSIVHRDGIWHAWYGCLDIDGGAPIGSAYAYSLDGITWVRPNVGRINYAGDTSNNLTHAGLHLSVMVCDDLPSGYRYIAAFGMDGSLNGAGPSYLNGGWVYGANSPDGPWTEIREIWTSPDFDSTYREGKNLTRRNDGRWLFIYEAGHPTDTRYLGRFLSDTTDLTGTWTDLGAMPDLESTSEDDQGYEGIPQVIDNLTWIMGHGRYNQTDQTIIIALHVSHDEGATWSQIDYPWININAGDPASFEHDMVTTMSEITQVSNIIWRLYYQGFLGAHETEGIEGRIALSTLGYGRLASVTGSDVVIITDPIVARDRLAINANTLSGTLKVELLDAVTGDILTGYDRESYTQITANNYQYPARWGSLGMPAGESVRVKLYISGATLYSIQSADLLPPIFQRSRTVSRSRQLL